MLDRLASDELKSTGATSRRGAWLTSRLPVLVLGAIVATLACGMYVVFAAVIQQSLPEVLLAKEGVFPFALYGAANLAVVLGATQATGRFDAKFTYLTHVVLVVHGVVALLVLTTHQPHSNLIMLLAIAISCLVGGLVVLWKHFVHRTKVGIIGTREVPRDILNNHEHVYISDPASDLQGIDIILIPEASEVSGLWSNTISKALLMGVAVRHIEEYLEELRGLVSPAHFEVDHVREANLISYRLGKRCVDVFLVLLSAPVAVILIAVAAVAIRLSMGANVVFVQTRVGQGGKPFRIYKLRTMLTDSEVMRSATTSPDDVRITPLGRWLRRYRIDELPQLWNVLRGDMSVIGPRPEWDLLVDRYSHSVQSYPYRSLVRPGITGWAQVKSGYASSADEINLKLSYDLYYVKNFSFGLDVQILLRTVWTVIGGFGAR